MPRLKKHQSQLKRARASYADIRKAIELSTLDIVKTHLNALDQEEIAYPENLLLRDEKHDLYKQDGYQEDETVSTELDPQSDPQSDPEPYGEDSNDEKQGLRTLAQLAKDTQILWRDHLRALRQNPEVITGRKRGPYFRNSCRTKRRRKAEDKENEKNGQRTLDLHFKPVSKITPFCMFCLPSSINTICKVASHGRV
jgi:hypothetical protein